MILFNEYLSRNRIAFNDYLLRCITITVSKTLTARKSRIKKRELNIEAYPPRIENVIALNLWTISCSSQNGFPIRVFPYYRSVLNVISKMINISSRAVKNFIRFTYCVILTYSLRKLSTLHKS